MLTITFRCGHRVSLPESTTRPVCSTCGETRRRTVHVPPPRFRGTVSGPYARTETLAPMAVPLVAKE